MKTALSLFSAAAVLMAIPGQASAAGFFYSLTPVGDVGYRASWQMSANPTPTQAVDGEGFALERVRGLFPRSSEGDAYLDFYFAANGGGLMISEADGTHVLATLYGAQLYTGSETAPTMLSGTFALTARLAGRRRYALQVADAMAAVPEPATWLLMISGIGMAGVALRNRHRATVRYA